jgi:hypothetical protein
MEINDISKIILVVSLSFSLVGISIQIMRLMGTFNDSLKDLQEILRSFGKISQKLSEDYDQISAHILTLTGAISKIGTDVIAPAIGLFGFLDRFKSKTKK